MISSDKSRIYIEIQLWPFDFYQEHPSTSFLHCANLPSSHVTSHIPAALQDWLCMAFPITYLINSKNVENILWGELIILSNSHVRVIKVFIVRLVHICFEKSSSTFWQVRCCAHRTRRSCQKYDKDFFKFCGLLRKTKSSHQNHSM